MSCEELLRDLAAADVRLSARGDRLHIDAPEHLLTDELKAELARHKPELLKLLEGGAELVASMKRLESARISVAVWPDGEMRVVTGGARGQAWRDGGTVYEPGEMLAYVQLSPAERKLFRDLKAIRQSDRP